MRNLIAVIDEIIKVTPEHEIEFCDSLRSLKDSLAYKPPEGQGLYWNKVYHIVNDRISGDESLFETWKKRVINIWTDSEYFNIDK